MDSIVFPTMASGIMNLIGITIMAIGTIGFLIAAFRPNREFGEFNLYYLLMVFME